MKKIDIYEIDEAIKLDYETEQVVTIGGHVFKILYMVNDRSNEYRVIEKGFTTKKAARDYCETCEAFWSINSYVEKVQ